MDNELKQHLEGMEARIMGRATGRIDAVEERLRDFITKAVHAMETKLLEEFSKSGRTSDMRTRQAMENVTTLNERMLAIEDRITSLERRRAA